MRPVFPPVRGLSRERQAAASPLRGVRGTAAVNVAEPAHTGLRYHPGVDRLRALNDSRPVTIAGTVVVLTILVALTLTGHNDLVIAIGAICGAILLIQQWYRTREQ